MTAPEREKAPSGEEPAKKPERYIPQFTFGDRTAKIRKDMGLEQKAFGELIGYSKSTVAGWEAEGKQPRDLVTVARRISEVSGVPLGWILGVFTDPEGGAFNPPYLRDETTLPDDSAPYETIDLREHQPTDPTCVPPSRDPGRTVKRRRTLRRRGTRPTDNRPPREATRNAA